MIYEENCVLFCGNLERLMYEGNNLERENQEQGSQRLQKAMMISFCFLVVVVVSPRKLHKKIICYSGTRLADVRSATNPLSVATKKRPMRKISTRELIR